MSADVLRCPGNTDYCDHGQIIKVTTPWQVHLFSYINLIPKFTVFFYPHQSNIKVTPLYKHSFSNKSIFKSARVLKPQDRFRSICRNIKDIQISRVFSSEGFFCKWYFQRISRRFYRLLDLTNMKNFHFTSNVHVDDDLNDFLRN